MTYAETIDYLFTRLPMFSRVGSAAYRKDLTNIRVLCERLGNPEHAFKSIHVAGTNGKGSVSHMLAAVLQTAGYKTGLYTSPHLYDFRERIRLNGQFIPETFVVSFVERIQPLIEEVEPSFFEITVAMAFDFFRKERVDIAVIEVGLGGRLDSTNIILPELSIITNIGKDHMNLLGDTIEEIAREKGGIMKQGIPLLVGEKQKLTEPIFEQMAAERKVPLQFASNRFEVTAAISTWHQLQLGIKDLRQNRSLQYELDLPGLYQKKNIITVLGAIECLKEKGWQLPDPVVHEALKKVKSLTGLHGRWELISEDPVIILEVAHNEDGIKHMLQHIASLTYRKLHLVIGVVKDKDTGGVIQLLPATARYYFTQAQIPRALPADDLKKEAADYGLHGAAYDDVEQALEAAKREATPDDIIIICGSIFLVAEVRKPRGKLV